MENAKIHTSSLIKGHTPCCYHWHVIASRLYQSKLLDAPSLTPAVLAVVRSRLVVLAHVYAHVVEVVEAPLLRDPLRGLAVPCDQTNRYCQLGIQLDGCIPFS